MKLRMNVYCSNCGIRTTCFNNLNPDNYLCLKCRKLQTKCEGCIHEFEQALHLQSEGYFYCTSKKSEFMHTGHFFLWMINEEGDVIL